MLFPFPTIVHISLILLSSIADAKNRRRCSFGDPCWPDDDTWQTFNASIGGRLIRSTPPAAVCHTEHFNAEQCSAAKENWFNSFWRTNQTGAYAGIVWEMGERGRCFVDTPPEAPCDDGLGK